MDKPKTCKNSTFTTIGFLGLGTMGDPMARNLLRAGFPLMVYDPRKERIEACVSAGATAAKNETGIVHRSEVVITSLPSSAVFVQVAEEHLLPNARPRQIFMDTGTTEIKETRRLAGEFFQKGSSLIDIPVSGGWRGAEAGGLRIFVGGEKSIAERCWPILEVLGDPKHIVYCGPSGAGQAVKGVNQLAMGLGDGAYLEAIAFGVRAGVHLDAIYKGIGGSNGWREQFASIAKQIMEGRGNEVYIKFPELPYFLREAHEKGFTLPITEALFAFCDAGPLDWLDNQGRPCVAFWHELMKRPSKAELGDVDLQRHGQGFMEACSYDTE